MPEHKPKSDMMAEHKVNGQYRDTGAARLSGRETLPPKSRTDWPLVDAKPDSELTAAAMADPDNQPLDDAFFETARRVSLTDLLRARKEQVTLRLERDTLEWFRSQGKGYQTRISAVLDLYVKSQTRKQGA